MNRTQYLIEQRDNGVITSIHVNRKGRMLPVAIRKIGELDKSKLSKKAQDCQMSDDTVVFVLCCDEELVDKLPEGVSVINDSVDPLFVQHGGTYSVFPVDSEVIIGIDASKNFSEETAVRSVVKFGSKLNLPHERSVEFDFGMRRRLGEENVKAVKKALNL